MKRASILLFKRETEEVSDHTTKTLLHLIDWAISD